jgi:hypothetical protein
LKAPGFNPSAYNVISWFSKFAFKFNLYHYSEGTNPPAAMAGLQRRRRQCALFGSLGPVYVFRDAIGARHVAQLAVGLHSLPVFRLVTWTILAVIN